MPESKNENRKAKTGETTAIKVKDFTDLDAWKVARKLRQIVYSLSNAFPAEERHVLTAQTRRAALSVTANLAEGYRRYSYQENSQYCRQSRASTYELRDHLSTAFDQGYISREVWLEADALARRVIQVLNGYIRSTQKLRRESERKQ